MFSLLYLSQRRPEYFATAPGPVADAAPVFPAWPATASFGNVAEWLASVLLWFISSIFNLFSGGGCIAGDSGATAEALFLSLKNSLFLFGWESADAARRVYGCLYGFESVSGISEPLVRVPLGVSAIGIAENIVGITLIVLLILALRNLLRAR